MDSLDETGFFFFLGGGGGGGGGGGRGGVCGNFEDLKITSEFIEFIIYIPHRSDQLVAIYLSFIRFHSLEI